MAVIINKKKIVAKMYDYSRIENYYKERGNFIFGWKELIKSETIKSEIILEISTECLPDRLLINNEEYKLIKM